MTARTTTKKKTSKTPPQGETPSSWRATLACLLAVVPLCAAITSLSATAAQGAVLAPLTAADNRTPQLRTVEGRVLDKNDDAPITGAVVYLKDTRTLSVKSYLTDDGGRFHFGQLADGADYEVWAEQNGKRSGSKTVSQFNSKLDIQFTLKIDRSK